MQLVKALGGDPHDVQKKWVTTPCLLAPWRHDGGKDGSPSAGITKTAVEHSKYNCFTCGFKGNLLLLVTTIHQYQKSSPAKYAIDLKTAMVLVMAEDDDLDDPLVAGLAGLGDDYDTVKYQHNDPVELHDFDEDWLSSFPSAKGLPYAYERGLTDEIIDLFEIKYDSYQRRLSFPIRDFEGALRGLHGRDVTNQNDLRYYSYAYKDKRNPSVWIGENLVDLAHPVCVTEGMIDMTQIWKAHPNVLASKSSAMSWAMLERIRDADVIITAYDLGVGGDKGRSTIENHFPEKTIVHLTPHPMYGDFGATPDLVIKELFDMVF
ncbi:MAG: hypothetical protein OEX12_13960 [Gammaproteobacteria bacterium]|nr:hypothetical protein [Gammaproteobacteria bacterium]